MRLLAACLLWLAAQLGAAGAESVTLPDGTFEVALPSGWDGNTPLALVMLLHGYRGSGADMLADADLVPAVTGLGAVLVAPDGIAGAWHFRGAPSEGGAARDDLAFLHEVRAEAMRRWPIDPARVVAAGFSIGASVVWDLACHDATGFTAFLPIAGSFWQPYPTHCETAPVTLRHVHGLADQTFPLAGRALFGGHARQGDSRHAIDLLLGFDRCSAPPVSRRDDGLDCQEWSGCDGGARVALCLHPGDHEMRADWLRGGLLWAFAAEH
jgi:polyhydroxybutyrate depolymerase